MDDPIEVINLDEHRHVDTLQSIENTVEVAADYIATYKDDIIIVDTTTANKQVTIPLSRGGKHFTVVKAAAAHNLVIVFTGGELFLGTASITLTALGAVQRLKGLTGKYIPI